MSKLYLADGTDLFTVDSDTGEVDQVDDEGYIDGYIFPIGKEIRVSLTHAADELVKYAYHDPDQFESIEQAIKSFALASALNDVSTQHIGEIEVDLMSQRTYWKGNTATAYQGYNHSLDLQNWLNDKEMSPITIRIDLDNDSVTPGTIYIV